MKIDRKVYWDTTCWLAWLNDERSWPNNVLLGIQDVVFEVEAGSTLLFTSAVTRGEIFFGKLTLDQKTAFSSLLRRSNVTEISADPRVMDRASQIREFHSARGQRVENTRRYSSSHCRSLPGRRISDNGWVEAGEEQARTLEAKRRCWRI